MKLRSLFLPFLILIMPVLISCTEKTGSNTDERNDLSTDEAVLEALRKEHGDIEEDDICIVRPSSFRKLIIVGFFAHDRGCDGGIVYYKGEKVSDENFSLKVLKDNGWGKEDDRQELALKWVREVSLVWESILSSEPERFDSEEGYTYFDPVAEGDGENIQVRCWIREPAGMLHEDNYRMGTFDFTAAKGLVKISHDKRFTVQYD